MRLGIGCMFLLLRGEFSSEYERMRVWSDEFSANWLAVSHGKSSSLIFKGMVLMLNSCCYSINANRNLLRHTG